ncbi:MAG: hypothetical protein MJB57_04555, partial [Gemmatimonadetes bacterium]|nr:hypothetical protein [Gemmatimonadota bacterium]
MKPTDPPKRETVPLATAYRDTGCGQLDASRDGEETQLIGWVHRRRDLGGLFFVDLRDRTGL